MLRTTATAVIINDLEIEQEIANVVPWFSEYWKSPDDPQFTRIRLDPIRVLFDHPNDGKKYSIDFEHTIISYFQCNPLRLYC